MSNAETTSRSVRVLLVDAASEDRLLFRRLLSKAEDDVHYDVTEVTSGEQAKAAIAGQRPDCVLLDYDLPDGNGLLLLREIVSTYGAHAFGVVMLTGAAATVIAVQALQSGAHDFLLKGSINAVLLQQGVRNAMEKAAIHRELDAKRAELSQKNEELENHVIQLEREAAERKRAELALRDSQAFLQSVLGATTDCLKVLDLEGRILWMSEKGLRALEIADFGPFQNVEYASFWAYDGKEEQARAAVAAAREGRIGRLQGCMPTISGKLKWWDVLLSPINGRDGRPEKILSVSRDVSDMRSADEALRESAAQLRLATTTGKVGVWSWDILADKVTWSESLYKVHGIEPGKFAGTVAAFSALIHPDDAERVRRAIEASIVGEDPYELEFRAVRPDGGIVWLYANATVVRKEGQPVNLLGATLDITERKRAEQHTEFLSQLGQQLGLLSDPAEMLRVAQQAVGRYLNVQRCFFFEVDEAGLAVTMHEDWRAAGLASAAGEYALADYGAPEFLTRLALPHFSVSDVTTDPLTRDRAESHLRLGSRAFATASYYQEGRWVACLGVSSAAVRHWRQDELNLLENAVLRVWPHLEKARADRLLIDSAEQLQLAASSAGLGTWNWNAVTDIVTFSPEGAEIFGIPSGPFMTWTRMRDMLHEEDRERARKAVEHAAATRSEYSVEYRVNRPDGRTVWVAAAGRAQYDADETLRGMVGVVQDVTRRKGAELATRQLAAIVESSGDAIVSKNLDGQVLTWNEGAEQLFGYTAEEMIGTSITKLLPAEQLDEEPQILGRIRRGDRIDHYETIRRHKSGRLLDVSLTVSPLKDENGVIVGASKIARDISSRKATERALTRRTRTLEILNRVGETLVAARDLEKIVQTVTDAAREISGAQFGAFFYNTRDEQGESYQLYTLSGLPRDAFAAFPMPRNTALFGPTFRGEGTLRIADVLVDERYGKNPPFHGMPQGHPPVRSYLSLPVKSGSGEVLGGMFFGHAQAGVFTEESEGVLEALAAQAAIAIDNANLYRAVQRELAEHKLAREAVRAREEQLRLVTNYAPVFLLQCDNEYRYRFANQPYAARYGLTPEQLVGRTVSEIAGRPAFEAAKHHIDAALAGERVEFEMEVPYEALGTRWVHAVLVPEEDENRKVLGFVGVLSDITQRKSAELELERARDEALAASRAKDDFLAALSHELRTPLNPVLLLASDAAENPDVPPHIRESFETIRRQVNLEARLIDDLLDLTRITRGKLSLDRRILDAHTLLTDAVATVRPELESKGLVFSLHLDAPEHMVFGDAVRLQQVLWNVLKNAVKFTGEKGRITARTSMDDKTRRLAISIDDTGIGLTQTELARVFEAFSQGDHAATGGSHRFGGLGLGLAISRSIVEMHGGEIRAASQGRNRGATFIIELPLMSVPTPTDQTPDSRKTDVDSGNGAPTAKRGRLLVIEDHAPTRNTLKNLLERRNFDVVVAGSAIEARELAQQRQPDLVISDIGLPDQDGCVLMTELRVANPTLPGIALSGYGMDEDLARTRAAGFVEHLTKPVNVGALERAIEKIFSSKS
jgi:PAS domain S-box-containing protein